MIRTLLSVLLFLAVGLAGAGAADPVVAVVDFKKALAAHPKAQALEDELRATQENAKKVFEAKQGELKELETAWQKANETVQSKDGNTQQNLLVKRDLEERIVQVRQSMIDVQARTRQTIADRQDAVLPDLAEEIRKLVSTANDGKYAVVLDVSALSRDGLPQVIEAPGAFDLTDRVIALLPAK
jgi:Skp family chaperone for outer membrane proteins